MKPLMLPLLWASFLSPIIASLFTLVVRSARRLMILSTASLALSAALLAYSYVYALYVGEPVYDPLVFYVSGLGQFALFLDSFSFMVSFPSAIVSCIVSVYSLWYMRHRFEELGRESWSIYYMLLLLFAAGLIGVGLANNAILFYLMLELTLIPSFLLIALYGYGERVRIALMYLIWTQVGSALFLLGAILAAVQSGGGFSVVNVPSGLVRGIWDGASPLALVLIVIGLGVKMALAGLHIWLPYAHAEAPTPLSALLSPNLIGVGAYGILRFAAEAMPSLFASIAWYLVAWALVTMIYGGFLALAQDDVKRFLAYSSVSQMGYLLLGLAGGKNGYIGAMLHYVSHAFGKAALFLAAGVLIVTLHTRRMSELGGLYETHPVTAAASLVGFLHLIGMPPTIGIWSKYFIILGFASLLAQRTSLLAIIALVAGTSITAVYSLIGFRRIFLGVPRHNAREHHGMAWACMAAGLFGVATFFLTPYLVKLTM